MLITCINTDIHITLMQFHQSGLKGRVLLEKTEDEDLGSRYINANYVRVGLTMSLILRMCVCSYVCKVWLVTTSRYIQCK